jgi:phospholipase D1/2
MMSTVCERRPPREGHDGSEHDGGEQALLAPAIFRPGENCWRVEKAERFYCIQDAADHFRLVRQAILEARDTVFILGWDIQATLNLVPGAAPDGAPACLNELLKFVVRRRPRLRVYLLIWDHAALYTIERDPFTRWRLGWQMPRQVKFGFDDHHPIGGSHHQKIVVVDDRLAFSGGIDLTGHRWDTPAHRVDEPLRLNANGTPYEPYHEVQAMVDGAAAASLGALVRDRWRALGEKTRPLRTSNASQAPHASSDQRDLWPDDVEPDFTDVGVAISRTMPASERDPEIRECERLFLDSIAAAERSIYIESQYFTNDTLGRALADRLQEPDGPEVIAVIPEKCHGWVEQQTMGALRDQVLHHLLAADRHRRLRIVYPAASRARGVSTFVHSKVMIVDGRFVRIGSANFSRRSMGVDTECDLAVDAGANEQHRAGAQRILDRLMGEHLGMPAGDVAAEVARLGSLRALIDARADADRTLLPVDTSHPAEPPAEVVTAVADPERPIGTEIAVAAGMTELVPPLDARADRGSIRLWLPAIALAVALLAVLRLLGSPGGAATVAAALAGAPQMASVFWTAVAAFLVAQFALIPLEVIVVLAGIILGGVTGGFVAIAGASGAAIIGYAAGRVMGRHRLASWMSRRAYRSTRQLGAHGVVGIAMLRMTSIASAGSVSLICGAASVPFGPYLIGSILGLIPVVIVLSAMGGLIRSALLNPGWSSGFMAVAGVLGVCVLVFVVRALLLMRQFSPTARLHRDGAEFG